MGLFKKKHKLLPNQTEITYKISAGIPFRWEVEVEDESIIKYVEKYVLKDENVGGLCGAPVYINYVFEGIKEGETKVIFKCYNFADDYVSVEEEYIGIVDSNNKITISRK